MEYQIPSDLLAYDDDPDAPNQQKIENVQSNARAIRRMIAAAKQRKEEEDRQRALKEKLERERLERERLEQERREREERERQERERQERERKEMEMERREMQMSSFDLAKSKPASPRKNVRKKTKREDMMIDRQLKCDYREKEKGKEKEKVVLSKKDKACYEEVAKSVVHSVPDLPTSTATNTATVTSTDIQLVTDAPSNAGKEGVDKGDLNDKKPEPDPLHANEKRVAPVVEEEEDYTKIPSLLESRYEQLDLDNALRPTTIKVGDIWSLESQRTLLSSPHSALLSTKHQEEERRKAFDLLDALSRSGTLSFGEHASLHVMICATHGFDKTLIDTVIQDNMNPIEKMERSLLIVATTVHNKRADEMIKEEELDRIRIYSSNLFNSPALPTSQSKGLPAPEKRSKKRGKGKEREKVAAK
jgi:hypothetical protein